MAKRVAKRITKAAVKKTLNAGVEASIKKAFGANHAIHIKDAGPTWVNSPHHLQDEVVNPVVNKKISVSVKRTR